MTHYCHLLVGETTPFSDKISVNTSQESHFAKSLLNDKPHPHSHQQMIILVGCLFILGVCTHFFRLTQPDEVVFDETHMGKFVSAYVGSGEHFFDIHPPHGKLIIAAFSYLGGYRGTFPFHNIGAPYGPEPVFWLRLAPAISGIGIPVIFFFLLHQFGASILAAFLGGLAVVFENALLLETRLLLFDGILIASFLASLLFFLLAEKRSGMNAFWLRILCGIMAGIAVGTKVTGLAIFGIFSIHSFVTVFQKKTRKETLRQLKGLVTILLPAVAVYLMGWWLHFALLDKPGPGDRFYQCTGYLFQDLIKAHYYLLSANLNLSQSHPDASPAWSWPLMKVTPFYWVKANRSIYLVGNPVVWWGTTFLMLCFLTITVLKRVTSLEIRSEKDCPRLTWLALTGYVCCYLPLWSVKRVLFLYHYLSALLFALAYVVLWLDRANWILPTSLTQQRKSFYAVIALLVFGFLAVSPLTYGVSWGKYDEWLVSLLRSWR